MHPLSAEGGSFATDPTSSTELAAKRPAAPRRLRVAMFVSNYPPHPGGLEVMVRGLSLGLGKRHEVVVVTSAYHAATGISQEDGITVHRIPATHVTESFGVPYPTPIGPGLLAAMRAVRDADVVHAHGALYVQTLLASRVAHAARVPLVIT